ncbi:hypothetical protein [Fimbriiglobus ruber]|uniref:hypothetical protein n=1 Tax=Fimbriiglobus ruber TaxID=1908690 RepID=UPI00117B7C20|nr:hypothetical protein [Fimbriiglobus ruber]
MPTVFRSMRMAVDGFPIVARSSSGLGVRVPGMIPPPQRLDVDVDASNNVIFNDKGMSVNDAWRNIPPSLLPRRCGGFSSDNRYCFKMGEGPFVQTVLAEGLELLPDSKIHGIVRPNETMPLAEYEERLVATRLEWQVDEA